MMWRRVAEVAIVVSVFAAPLMIGSVPIWAVAVGLALSSVAAFAACLAARQEGSGMAFHPLAWAFLAVVCLQGLQIVPLPPGLVSFLSPKAADVFSFSLADAGGWPAWRALSLDPIQGGVELARHATWLMLLLASTYVATRRDSGRILVKALAFSAVVVVSLALMHKLAGADLIFGLYPRPPGGWLFASFVNPNHLGAFLDLLAPVCLGLALASRDKASKVLWGLAFVLAGATCFLTLSRGGIVALIAGVTVFTILWRRSERSAGGSEQQTNKAHGGSRRGVSLGGLVVLPLLIGGVLTVAAYLALEPVLEEVSTLVDQSRLTDETRWRIWGGALPLIRDYWAVGAGRGSFALVYPMYKLIPGQVTYSHAENQLVQTAAELGLVVALLMTALMAWVWLSLARRPGWPARYIGLLAGLAGLAVHEMTDFATAFGGVAVPASVVLGVLLAGSSRRVNGGSRVPRRRPPAAGTGLVLTICLVLSSVSTMLLARAWGSSADDSLTEVVAELESGVEVDEAVVPALLLRPADHMLPLVAAHASLERRDAAGAMTWVNKALYLAPSDVRGHLLAAEALSLAGREDQALLQYRLAIEWGASVRSVLAVVSRRYEDVEQLRKAVPRNEEARRELVRFLLRQRRHDDAWSTGYSFLHEAPNDLELKDLLARSALALGLLDEAEALSRELLEFCAKKPSGYGLLASVMLAGGDIDAAFAAFEDGLDSAPGDVDLSIGLARAHIRHGGDPEAAIRLLDSADRPRAPRTRSRMHMLRGESYAAMGRTRQAMDEYRTAARLAPNDPRPRMAKGDHFMALDQWERALEAYEEALRLRPSASIQARVERAAERVEALRAFRSRKIIYGDGDLNLPVPGDDEGAGPETSRQEEKK